MQEVQHLGNVLYGDAMLTFISIKKLIAIENEIKCPFEGHQYGRRKPTQTSVFLIFLLMREFIV